jgi:hypothetical protein
MKKLLSIIFFLCIFSNVAFALNLSNMYVMNDNGMIFVNGTLAINDVLVEANLITFTNVSSEARINIISGDNTLRFLSSSDLIIYDEDGAIVNFGTNITIDSSKYLNLVIDLNAPVVTLDSSFNDTVLNNTQFSTNFSFVDEKSIIADCDLIINGVKYNHSEDLSNNTVFNSVANSSLMNGTYSVYVNCTDLASKIGQSNTYVFYMLIRPNITSHIPNESTIYTSENETLNFNASATDYYPDTWYQWFKDSVSQSLIQAWTWIVGYDESGTHNVTVEINNTVNEKSYFNWIIYVNNTNRIPVVNDIWTDEVVMENNATPFNIYCNGTDSESNLSDMTAEISFKKTGDIFYATGTPSFNSTIEAWYILVNTSSLSIDTYTIRCRFDDSEDSSEYRIENGAFEIVRIEYTPTTPKTLIPQSGSYDYNTLVSCSGSSDENNDDIYYDIDYSLNSGDWINFSYSQLGNAFFDFAKLNYSDEVDFRCRAEDSLNYSSEWFNPTGVSTRLRGLNFFIFDPSFSSYYFSDVPRQFGVRGDLNNVQGVVFKNVYIDCNGDGMWDYVTDNSTGWKDLNTTGVGAFSEFYWCIFPKGNFQIEAGATIIKNTTNWASELSVCNGVVGDECRVSKKYSLRVLG